MTKCDEALRLRMLERIEVLRSAHPADTLWQDLAAFLAGDIPAARAAGALKSIEHIGAIAAREWQEHRQTLWYDIHVICVDALAGTSPAAAALLAQGKRLREEESDLRMVAAHLELLEDGPDVSDYLIDALLIMRRVLAARAALAPREPCGTCKGTRVAPVDGDLGGDGITMSSCPDCSGEPIR